MQTQTNVTRKVTLINSSKHSQKTYAKRKERHNLV